MIDGVGMLGGGSPPDLGLETGILSWLDSLSDCTGMIYYYRPSPKQSKCGARGGKNGHGI